MSQITNPTLVLKMPIAEVSAHFQQADQEFTLAWKDTLVDNDNPDDEKPGWYLEIKDTCEICESETKQICMKISLEQAAAFLFIWATSDEPQSSLHNEMLGNCYKIVEDIFKNVPNNLRPIP